MENLVKALGRLATRDIPHIIGGASVILSFLYLFANLSIPIDLSTPEVLLFVGIAYVVGYTIQDTLGLTPIINSSIVVRPGAFLKWLYKKWARTEWEVAKNFDIYREYVQMYIHLNFEQTTAIERIIFLKTIGNSTGSNWLVASLLLGIKGLNTPTTFNISLAVSAFIISVILILLGWLQGLQAIKALFELHKASSSNPAKNTKKPKPVRGVATSEQQYKRQRKTKGD
jgi:hypothetical protein